VYAQRTAGICISLRGIVSRERNLLVALCTAAVLCSLSPALDLGLMVGTDGVTSATSPLKNVYLNSAELPDRGELGTVTYFGNLETSR